MTALRTTVLALCLVLLEPGVALGSGSGRATVITPDFHVVLQQTARKMVRDPGEYFTRVRERFAKHLSRMVPGVTDAWAKKVKKAAPGVGRFDGKRMPVVHCNRRTCTKKLAAATFPAAVALPWISIPGDGQRKFRFTVPFTTRPTIEQLARLEWELRPLLRGGGPESLLAQLGPLEHVSRYGRFDVRSVAYFLPRDAEARRARIKAQLATAAKQLAGLAAKPTAGARLARWKTSLPFIGDKPKARPAQTTASAHGEGYQVIAFYAVAKARDPAALAALQRRVGAMLSAALR